MIQYKLAAKNSLDERRLEWGPQLIVRFESLNFETDRKKNADSLFQKGLDKQRRVHFAQVTICLSHLNIAQGNSQAIGSNHTPTNRIGAPTEYVIDTAAPTCNIKI